MPNLEELMAETERAMARNLAQNLYGGDDWLTRSYPSRPKPLLARLKSFIGQLFLKAANAFGESDWE